MTYTIALNKTRSNSSTTRINEAQLNLKTSLSHDKSHSTIYSINNSDLSSNTKKKLLQLESFRKLQNNWDSYDAEKPSLISIDNAIRFIKTYKNDFEVYFTAPGRDGDILLEYQFNNNISIEIYFKKDGSDELYIFSDNNCIKEGTIYQMISELFHYQYE